MVHLLLQAICISLFGYSLGFIFLELKTKFDRSFLYFGITLVLLCMFCAIDLWKQPLAFNLKWTNIQHVLSCFITPFFLKYLIVLTKRQKPIFHKILFIISGLISILFMLNLMFVMKDNSATPNLLYLFLFMPYTLFSAFYINYHVITSFLKSTGFDKKIYFLHLLGFGLITICGLLDFVTLLYNKFFIPVVSFTIFGVIGLGILLSYIFTERLVLLIREKNRTLNDLKLAYTELEHALSLSELGQSSAIINHEIKNYACAIRGYLDLIKLRKDIPEKPRVWLNKAIASIEYLTQFSNSILDFSKSKILKDKKPLDIYERINRTISEHFPNQIKNFKICTLDDPVMIHGDWLKLNHVFLNMFKNSFEAGATEIMIKILHKDNVSLVTIEDNGCGIDPKKINDIFKAFFSTKGRQGGSGLGMSITRSIIEGHGGYISVFTKNSKENKDTGLMFNITFPAYSESMEKPIQRNTNIVLIQENLEQLPMILKTFQNAFVIPSLIQNVDEFDTNKYLKEDTVILGSPEMIGDLNRRHNKYRYYSFVNNNNKGLYVVGNNDDSYKGYFNENFILKNLPVN